MHADSSPLKILYLFGDAGRYAGQVRRAPGRDMHFWKYYFDDYMTVSGSGAADSIDVDRLRETVEEIYSGAYDAVACDSHDALLLQFYGSRREFAPVPFLINEVDMFHMAEGVRRFIKRSYREDPFKPFLRSPHNLWVFIEEERRAKYERMGIPAQNLFYVPLCEAGITFALPGYFDARQARPRGAALAMKGKIIAAGTHNRDFATLAKAVDGTGLEVHVITNLKQNPPVECQEIAWHSSLPEAEYNYVLAHARCVVLPLRDDGRAAGQLACAMAMRQGRAIVAADVPSLRAHIRPGESGLLYAPGNADRLREALLAVDRDPELAERLGRGAVAVEKRLSQRTKKTIDSLMERIGSL